MTTNTSNIADARNTDNKNNQQPMTCGAMMRFVAAAIILMTSMPAMAQVNFGICGGVVIEQSMPDSDSKDSERYIGYTAGAIVDFDLPAQGLGIEAGAMCTKHTYGKPSMEQYSVDVPVHVRYRLEVPVVEKVVAPYVFTGPAVSAGVSNKMPKKVDDVKMSLRWNVGAGVQMFKHVRVAATYGIQVSKTDIVDNGSLVKGKKGNCWSISAAVMF